VGNAEFPTRLNAFHQQLRSGARLLVQGEKTDTPEKKRKKKLVPFSLLTTVQFRFDAK
jgi:hypothetical protein